MKQKDLFNLDAQLQQYVLVVELGNMTYVNYLQLGLFPLNKTVHTKLSEKRQFH